MSSNTGNLTFSDVTFKSVDLTTSNISAFDVKSATLETLDFSDLIAKDVDLNLQSPAVMVNGHYTPVDQSAYQGQFIKQVGFNVVTEGSLTVYILDGVNTANCNNVYQATLKLKKGQIWYDFNMYLPASMHLSFGQAGKDTAGVGTAAGAEQFYYNSGQLDSWASTWGVLNMGVKIKNTFNIQHSLKGKTFSVIGDSISTYMAYNGKGVGHQYPINDVQWITDTWWVQLAIRTGSKLVKNNAISATTVSKQTSTTVTTTTLQDRVNVLSDNLDVCFIEMGTNDLLHGRAFGSFDPNKNIYISGTTYDPSQGTFNPGEFTDAMCNSIVQLQTNYPTTKFVWIIPMMMFVGGKPPYTNNGQTNDTYKNRIIEICNFYNIEYIDTTNIGINYINYTKYLIDGVHPNKRGFIKLADCIINSYK